MAFNIPSSPSGAPSDPVALLRDLRKRSIGDVWSHQGDVLRAYVGVCDDAADLALQLPTGSGKTLVGLLIGEWRRRKLGHRVLYLCPTNQLVNQVVSQAASKYGLHVRPFTGSRTGYRQDAKSEWLSAEALGITNYSSLFNTNPFFEDPQTIILDDAHSAENYIADFWSLLIEHTRHGPAFAALSGVLERLLPADGRTRLRAGREGGAREQWVEKVPTPRFFGVLDEVRQLLDEHAPQSQEIGHRWAVLRDALEACHVYVSATAILIRPVIPPSGTHAPFASAQQRVYMSATLGSGGELERITGQHPIKRVPAPEGWDQQGIGRRFFVFPQRSLDEEEAAQFAVTAMRRAGRTLYLTPDERTAEEARRLAREQLGCPVFSAREIEDSKAPFVEAEQAVAAVANRYDGVDLVDDECRQIVAEGLPRGTNLQERFLTMRVGASVLLDDRILTRIVQGFGRCTRSPNDHAAVIVLGEQLQNYLLKREQRSFFHPEIQAELEFGQEQSRNQTTKGLVENIGHFLDQDDAWTEADAAIVQRRSDMSKNALPGESDLRDAVGDELKYQYSLWSGDYVRALEACRGVLGALNDPALRGYRAWWLYLAGSAAWLAQKHGHIEESGQPEDFFRQAHRAAPSLRWLAELQRASATDEGSAGEAEGDDGAEILVENLERVFDRLGTTHDRKYNEQERRILDDLSQNEDGKQFERGHEELGRMLGYEAGNSEGSAAPDPWWTAGGRWCFVFEDHAEGDPDGRLSAHKARQACGHPRWVKQNVALEEDAKIISVLVTPVRAADQGAEPHLEGVRCWGVDGFRQWAEQALRVVRDLRANYPEAGNLGWRSEAANRLREARIAPKQLDEALGEDASEALQIPRQPM